MDIEKLDFKDDIFDFVYSSLTMHYLKDWKKALKCVHAVLKDNGRFLFSMTHPMFSAMQRLDSGERKSRLMGYKEMKNTDSLEIYGDYLSEYKKEITIDRGLKVSNYHRPLSIIMKDIVDSGFDLIDIVEPKALLLAKKDFRKFWEIHQKIPQFILFELRKK